MSKVYINSKLLRKKIEKFGSNPTISRRIGKSNGYLANVLRNESIDTTALQLMEAIYSIDLQDVIVLNQDSKNDARTDSSPMLDGMDYVKIEDSISIGVSDAIVKSYRNISKDLESTIYLACLSAMRKAMQDFTEEYLSGLSKDIKNAIIDGFKQI